MRPVFFFPRTTVLDCGASRTTLAVFSAGRAGHLRLERFATVSHAVEPGQEGRWLEKTAEALQVLRDRVAATGSVTVILPPHVTLMKMFSTPRVKAAKRDKIINFESQQSIPYPLNEVVWDRLIIGENSHSFNVLLCAAKLEVVDPLCTAITAAGLTPSVLLPSVLALVTGFRQGRPAPGTPLLLVNIGARSTTLALLNKASFQARSLSLGGNSVTQSIAEEKSCEWARAEELKVSADRESETASAARLFASRLAQEIVRTLVHFREPSAAESPLGVMLTGGAARLPGLSGLLATQLNLPVSLLSQNGSVEVGCEVGDFRREDHGAALGELAGGSVNAGQERKRCLQSSAAASALSGRSAPASTLAGHGRGPGDGGTGSSHRASAQATPRRSRTKRGA